MTTSSRPSAPDKADIERLYAALMPGRENAQTASQLCVKLGHADTESNRRTIRLLAEYSLDFGIAICSGNAGYWTVRDLEDITETCGRLESQAARMFERSRQLRYAAEKMLTQTSLWG